MRGVSAWNFDVAALKQAASVCFIILGLDLVLLVVELHIVGCAFLLCYLNWRCAGDIGVGRLYILSTFL